MVKPVLEILAGIPSVVLGFLALTFISPEIVQRLFGEATQFNMMAAGIGVGLRGVLSRATTLLVLEAAHLFSYAESGVHRLDGGFLLRRDLRARFDVVGLRWTQEPLADLGRPRALHAGMRAEGASALELLV